MFANENDELVYGISRFAFDEVSYVDCGSSLFLNKAGAEQCAIVYRRRRNRF